MFRELESFMQDSEHACLLLQRETLTPISQGCKPSFPLLWREMLLQPSVAVHYTITFENIMQNKGQSVSLHIGCAETQEAHKELSVNTL